MSWFYLALLASFLYSITNHIDKYVITRYFKNTDPGAFILFTTTVGTLFAPVVVLFKPSVVQINPAQALVVMLSGAVFLTGLVIYFYALENEEASVVVPIYQTIPIFVFVLAFIFLGEKLSLHQIGGSLLVVVGSIALSIEHRHTTKKIKTKVLALMLLASFCAALSYVIFKVYALETDYWTAIFWNYVGYAVSGLIIFVCVQRYRVAFLNALRKSKASVIAVNIFNELCNVSAQLIKTYATLLAPVALVSTVNGFQPLFVLLLGVVITVLFPRIAKEEISRQSLVQKIASIAIIFLGTYILNR